MSHLIKGFAAASMIAIVATSAWASSARAQSLSGPGSWMGVKVAPLSDGWREQYSYSRAGIRVTEVESEGPADRIGIVPGDILVAVGFTSLRNVGDLVTAHSRVDQSQPIPVTIVRNNGKVMKIRTMEPVPAPAPEPVAAAPAATVAVAPATENVAAVETAKPPATEAAGAEPKTDPLTTLGLQCANLNRALASALGASKAEGVLVLEVESGGQADRAGIHAGDVITGAGSQAIGSVETLVHALSAAPAGITLHTLRRTEERDVTVALVAPPTEQEAVQQELRKLREEIEALRKEMAAPKNTD